MDLLCVEFGKHFIEAFPGAEDADVGGGCVDECTQYVAIVFVVVGHEDAGGVRTDVEVAFYELPVA